MDIGQFAERHLGMDDKTWIKHSNPWSGWTRMTILPLFSLAIWSRVWLGWDALWPIAAVVLWTWLNPRLFRPPTHNDAWMTKGVLGERVWLAKTATPIPAHHVKMGRLLNWGAGVGLAILIYGLWQLDLGLVLTGLVATMGAKLWFLDRMVWLFADTSANRTESTGSPAS
ncbi:DUF6653 family protein [Ruegeria sp. EL01]|jgi:hypothetical protein|uniref:DUF6653 family protein n=1 Tax=Ruegeria sp. EL01 TaxID=2107578 RepID=UPI000EA82665|nr:DUF6653 family protein [Ruegeria sp. EL01]